MTRIYLVEDMYISMSSAKSLGQALLAASVAASKARQITSAGTWRTWVWILGEKEVLDSPCAVRICHPTYVSGRRSNSSPPSRDAHGLCTSRLFKRKELTSGVVAKDSMTTEVAAVYHWMHWWVLCLCQARALCCSSVFLVKVLSVVVHRLTTCACYRCGGELRVNIVLGEVWAVVSKCHRMILQGDPL